MRPYDAAYTPAECRAAEDRILRDLGGVEEEAMATDAKPENWSRLVALMPARLVGGFDALTHKTVADLIWLAQHEIDLHEEGDEPMTATELRHITDYLRLLRRIR